ncbi:MAG: hypothetical protein J6T03_02545 [Bacteroidales bacterium]|nr:hypothetical protein [Bacteroidales bacterium]
MFEVEKPRRFHYEPRFYDPEKEKWEALKKKYAIEQEKKANEAADTDKEEGAGDADLDYFERKVRTMDSEKRQRQSKLTLMDLFRKREMPTFNYQPRFSGTTTDTTAEKKENMPVDDTLTEKYRQAKRQIKIKRRFDISDTNYMKPVSGTKIILYCFIVFLLLSLIFSF